MTIKVLRKFVTYGVGNILQTSLSFILLPLYLRVFSPNEYGVIAVIMVVLGLLNLFTSGGVINGLMRLYYESEGRERKELVGATWLWYLAMASVGGIILLSQAPLISSLLFYSESYVTPFRLLGFIFFLTMLRQVPFNLFRLENKAELYVIFSLFNFLTDFGLKIYLIVYLGRGINGYMESGIISNFLTLALMLPFTLKQAQFTTNPFYLKQLLRLGIPFVFSGLAIWVLEVSDRILLGRLSGEAAVGMYALAYNFANIFSILLATPVSLLLEPFFFAHAAERSSTDTKGLLQRTLIYCFLGGGVVYLAISLGSSELLRAFTLHLGAKEKYLEGVYLVPIITVAPFLYFLCNQATLAGMTIKRPEIGAIACVIAAGIKFSLNLIIIPQFGALGAAITTIIAYVALIIIFYRWMSKIFPISYDWKALCKALGYLTLAFAIGWQIKLDSILTSFTLRVVVPIVIFAILAVFTGNILTKVERDWLHAFVRTSCTKLVAALPINQKRVV